MARHSRLPWFLTLAVFLATGCSDVVERPETAPLSLAFLARGMPLEGVELCESNTDNCAVSGADGRAAIPLRINQETSYTLEREGYDPQLLADVVSTDGVQALWEFGGFEVEAVAELYQSVMSPYPRLGTGEIFITQPSGPNRLAGVTYDLLGATAKRYYQEGSAALGTLAWRLDLTATTANGGGGFLEVTPGTYEVRMGGATSGCSPTVSGWPGKAESHVRVPVREGHVTRVIVACAPPP